jgi:hypothetical protein
MGMLTRRSFGTAALGLLALLLALSAVAPLAHASESEEGVTFQDEGWWLRYREPLTDVPAGGGVGLPDDATEIPRATLRDQTNQYKGEYTRVSTFPSDEGDETIAAFAFDLFTLGGGAAEAQVTGGTVTFVAGPQESGPGEGDGANGQRNEENAAMVACVATDFAPPDFAGNWDERPAYDPEVCAPLELAEERVGEAERPSWTLDLAAFAGAWAEQNFGFVVVPDPEREGDGSFFHVAFPNTMNTAIDLEEYPAPTADVTFEVEEFDFPDFGADDAGGDDFGSFDAPESSGDPGFDSGDSGGFDSGDSGGFDSGDSAAFDSGTADPPITAGDDADFEEPEAEPQIADEEQVDEGAAAPPAQTPTSSDEGGTNLAYLLVPLLGLGLAGTLGYSLSKDPELALEREGAVSKLMARRQAQGALGAGDA